ncbi:hypothetical protein O9992_27625 [Vibrio lentus]|nr:hypothetical protein [Vibrio lentus]
MIFLKSPVTIIDIDKWVFKESRQPDHRMAQRSRLRSSRGDFSPSASPHSEIFLHDRPLAEQLQVILDETDCPAPIKLLLGNAEET